MRSMLIALMLTPAAAFASDLEEAKERFLVAREHHEAGRYSDAIEAYESVYALRPVADILFNIGQCYRNDGDVVKAVNYFARYLEALDEDSSERPRVEALIAELQAKIPDPEPERELQSEPEPEPDPEPEARPEPELESELDLIVDAKPVLPRAEAPPPRQAVAVSAPPIAEADGGVATKWWFWTVVGVAAAGAAAGTVAAVSLSQRDPTGSLATIDAR